MGRKPELGKESPGRRKHESRRPWFFLGSHLLCPIPKGQVGSIQVGSLRTHFFNRTAEYGMLLTQLAGCVRVAASWELLPVGTVRIQPDSPNHPDAQGHEPGSRGITQSLPSGLRAALGLKFRSTASRHCALSLKRWLLSSFFS